jgi:putative nucleotidyltransferase with HDIG domain
MAKINELLKKIEYLPSSPALLPKLARTLDNINHASVHEIVDLIMYDSALTAKLLQIANSAFFGKAKTITNIGEAVSQIGYDSVYLLAASLTGEKCLQTAPGTGLDAVLLWKHSVTTAFGAHHLARAAGLDGNLMFTTGLLHDLGKVVFTNAYGKDYTANLHPTRRGAVSLIEWENTQYGCNHAEVGAALLERWNLPPAIVAGVKFHHHFYAAGEYAPLAACVCLGNVLSRALDQSIFTLDLANPDLQPALQRVNLTTDDLCHEWQRLRKNWEFVQKLCELRKN